MDTAKELWIITIRENEAPSVIKINMGNNSLGAVSLESLTRYIASNS